MSVILKIFAWLIFLLIATGVMIVAGVAGVAGSFYMMVNDGNIMDNLYMTIGVLAILFVLSLLLRQQNKKVIRMRKKHNENDNDDKAEA